MAAAVAGTVGQEPDPDTADKALFEAVEGLLGCKIVSQNSRGKLTFAGLVLVADIAAGYSEELLAEEPPAQQAAAEPEVAEAAEVAG